MLFKATLIGAAALTAAFVTLPASARPNHTGHDVKTASLYRGRAASVARIRVNHFGGRATAPLRWPVHFDDQFVLDP